MANRTDDSVALVNLPLTALIDRKCASACEQFAGAVKDLQLGPLVGTRTAGRANPAGAQRAMRKDSSVQAHSL
jgi:carboxyl-terminal processing protease